MTLMKRLRCRLFGDADLLRLTRAEREMVKAQRHKAEQDHIENTNEMLRASLRDLCSSDEVSQEIEDALRSLEQR